MENDLQDICPAFLNSQQWTCSSSTPYDLPETNHLSVPEALIPQSNGELSPNESDWGSYIEGEYVPEVRPMQEVGWEELLPVGKRKRGRKPKRPYDPIKKKTEEKDKYWLRLFRVYMKRQFKSIRMSLSPEDRFFWRDYLSSEGKPEKGGKFLSYGKQYKNHLFSNPSFVQRFKDWFEEHAGEELSKKCSPDSDFWFVYYDYGETELCRYSPDGG